MKYVIRYNLEPVSYYRRMTPIGPAFGASLGDTPKMTRDEANGVWAQFSLVASCCASVLSESDARGCDGSALRHPERAMTRVTAETISEAHIWDLVLVAHKRRDARLLGYCDAALRGGRRRGAAGLAHCAAAWNARHAKESP